MAGRDRLEGLVKLKPTASNTANTNNDQGATPDTATNAPSSASSTQPAQDASATSAAAETPAAGQGPDQADGDENFDETQSGDGSNQDELERESGAKETVTVLPTLSEINMGGSELAAKSEDAKSAPQKKAEP